MFRFSSNVVFFFFSLRTCRSVRSTESLTASGVRLRKLERQRSDSEVSVSSSASKKTIKVEQQQDQQGKLIEIEKSRTGGVRRFCPNASFDGGMLAINRDPFFFFSALSPRYFLGGICRLQTLH